MQSLKENWLLLSKNVIRNLGNFTRVVKNLKICTLRDLFCPRFLRRSYVSWHWRVMKYLKKNWLVVWKMTQEFCLVFMGAVESVKICTFILPFFHTKTYRRVISHDTEEWSKLWRDTDFYLKNDMRNLVIFNASSEKSEKICTLMGYVCRRYVMFELKKMQRTCVAKSDLRFWKWNKDFGKFSHK